MDSRSSGSSQFGSSIGDTGASSVIGQQIAGKYELIRLVGQGGMGAVYEGRNIVTLKRCAVKLLLSPELATMPHVVKRFFREAQASSVVESEHIVQIFDSGADPRTGFPYMVMELLQGEDLEGTLRRLGALHPAAAAKVALQAAIGLARAHDGGIVHRDIKPANLFLARRDMGDLLVKLLDFGIAKVKMENYTETSQGLTRTGSMLGTPLYMSPEQAKGAADIDARSDVWSLGGVLYELLTGRLPYGDSNSLGELMVSIITSDIPLIQDRAPWVPAELAEIVHRAISRDIDKRYRNAGEFRDALAHLVPEGPRLTPQLLVPVNAEQKAFVAPRLALSDDGLLRARAARTQTAVSQTADTSPRKRSAAPAVAAAAAVLAIAAAGAGGVAWKLTRPPPPPEPARSVIATVSAPSATAPLVEPVQTPVASYDLAVGPEDVQVEVDGEKRQVSAGKLKLTGAPGSTFKIVLSRGGDRAEHRVAVTLSGLVPERLELRARPIAPQRSNERKKSSVKPAEEAAKPAAEGKAPAKPLPPRVETGTDEFK